QLVGELIKICGQNQVALGIPKNQNQPKDLQTEEKQQHSSIQYCWPYHGQTDGHHHPQGICSGSAGGLLNIGAHAAQGSRNIEIGMWYVGQSCNNDNAGKGVDIPGDKANQVLDPYAKKPYRPCSDDITEA